MAHVIQSVVERNMQYSMTYVNEAFDNRFVRGGYRVNFAPFCPKQIAEKRLTNGL